MGGLGEVDGDVLAVVGAAGARCLLLSGGRRFGGGVGGGGVFEGLGEALEGLPDEPELVVGAGVGVAVRVPAHGQALVGALDLGGAGIGRDAQDLMEIDGRHPRILIAAGAGRAMK